MNASSWFWRLLCTAGVVAGLCLTGPSWAQSKKDSSKGTDDKNVIVIQLDKSKVSPELIKALQALAKDTGKKDDDKKTDAKKGDDDKKKDTKKGDDDKKTDAKKPNIVQVDLNKLSPDLAKRLTAELAKSKGKDDDKKGGKKDDDDKKKGKKGEDDDDKKGKGKDDDKKGKDKDDDDKKGGKGKDEAKSGGFQGQQTGEHDDDKKGGKKQDDDDKKKGGKKKND